MIWIKHKLTTQSFPLLDSLFNQCYIKTNINKHFYEQKAHSSNINKERLYSLSQKKREKNKTKNKTSLLSLSERAVQERWVSGGFADKTLQRYHRRCYSSIESQQESDPFQEEPKWWPQKQKWQPGAALASYESSAWRFTVCGCPFFKSPSETHVHCLIEEATRLMFTKLKDSNTQHIDLKKNVWAGGWVNTHYDLYKRMMGGSELPWFLCGSLWLVGCCFLTIIIIIIIIRRRRTITWPVGHSQYWQDANCLQQCLSRCGNEFTYSRTTTSKW